MNITFQNQPGVGGNQSHRTVRVEDEPGRAGRGEQKKASAGSSAAVDVSFLAGTDGFGPAAMGMAGNEPREKAKTLTELQQEAANIDVGVSQDYMTLMSHTMSEEDYAKISEEGFHFQSMDPEEAVTIVDRIKAELVRSGKQVAGYTDDLDLDTLAAAVGSDTLARAITDAFRAADIPLTRENMESVRMAWDMVSQLEIPTEDTYQYMVDNSLEPEIWNYYLAQNSGAAYGQNGAAGQTASHGQKGDGYAADFLQDENMRRQIDRVLEQAGYEINEENREAANWLLERNLPLTGENLGRLEELRSVSFPVTEEAFAGAAAGAVAEGREPIHANLAAAGKSEGNLYEKAVEVLDRFRTQYETMGDIAARKQLEEVRLRMTAEVNVRLIKSGFAIDTAPMEELINALREAEKAVAEQYFPGDESAVSKYENWNETNQVMAELPALPAQLLGIVQSGAAEETTVLSYFHAEGRALQQTYEKAGESYEALMTAPRADLGDSIRKAFANVDDIVEDLGLEVTEENRRAVRILGYNHMEMNLENIRRVREADAQVQNLMERMTPAATLKMIRDGVNPLEQSFEQLNRYFDELPESYQEQAESYSKYLYGLEQNKQITSEERESYIGVYRLLRQIERSDGAVVGAVVNTQAQLQFSNLLSAVRSGKFRHMDVKATDELGMLKELVRKGESASISEQISKSYEKQQLEEIRRAVQTDPVVPAMLQRGGMPANAENLLAAQGLVRDAGNPFRTLREKSRQLRGESEFREKAGHLPQADELWTELDDKEQFREQYDDMISDLQAEAEELTLSDAQTSLDVRSMQMVHKQLSIMGSLAGNEEYILPMYVGEELAAVHLTLERGTGDKGRISISVDFSEESHMEAHLQVKNGRVEGFLVGNTAGEVTKLQAASDIFSDLIKQNASMDLEAAVLPVVSRGNIKLTGMSENNSQEPVSAPDNGMLYHVAKLFLQAIR